MHERTILIVSGIMFVATVFRTTFGFGEALVSVPLLALLIPLRVATPIAILASVTVAAIVGTRDWRHIHFRSAGWLVLSTLFGLPLGLIILKTLPELFMKSALAALLLGFSCYSLIRPRRIYLQSERFAWVFGFTAGVLGGSYGLNGPPLAIYGSLRKWSPERFRATLQAYFLPASALGICGFGLSGLWTPLVIPLFLWSIPAIAMGIVAGRLLSQRIPAHRFDFFVHIVLILIALMLLAKILS